MFFNMALVSSNLSVEENFLDILQRYQSVSSGQIECRFFSTCLDFMCEEYNMVGYDIVLLDLIHNSDGLALAEKIRQAYKNQHTDIIFLTDNDVDFQKIANLQPLYCLNQPIDNNKIAEAIKIVQSRKLQLPCIFKFIDSGNVYFFSYKEIVYFYVENNLIHMYSQNQEKPQMFYCCLNQIEKRLNTKCFTRIHRSYLVNNLHIKKYQYHALTMSNGDVLSIGQTKRKIVKKIITTLQIDKKSWLTL